MVLLFQEKRNCARYIRTGSYLSLRRLAGSQQILTPALHSHASCVRNILLREKPLANNSLVTFQPHCSGFIEVKAEKVGPCRSQALARLHRFLLRRSHTMPGFLALQDLCSEFSDPALFEKITGNHL